MLCYILCLRWFGLPYIMYYYDMTGLTNTSNMR